MTTPLQRELERMLPAEDRLLDPADCWSYGADNSRLHAAPEAVVFARDARAIVELVQLCRRLKSPLIVRGRGTGTTGAVVPQRGGVVLSLERMNRILEVDPANRWLIAEAGVTNTEVQQAAGREGFFWPPDPTSSAFCTIGGNLACNAAGPRAVKYGTPRDNTLGLAAVAGTGEALRTGVYTTKGVVGYDLTRLIIGSEGTLGLATEITLRIVKTPDVIRVLLADFTSIEAAGQSVSDIISAGIIPGGMEIMDNFSINAVEDVVSTNCYPRDATAILLVELDGLEVEVEAASQKVEAICRKNGARNLQSASDPQERLTLWKGRKAAFAAVGKISPDYYVQDGVVPRSKLPEILEEIEALSQRSGYRIANVFHAGDGNLHPLILYDNSVPGELEKVEEVGGEILKLCVKKGGTISGEHGIGADKRCYMPELFNETDLATMLWVRDVFDPKRMANPDKIFPTPKTCGEAARAQAQKEFPAVERY